MVHNNDLNNYGNLFIVICIILNFNELTKFSTNEIQNTTITTD